MEYRFLFVDNKFPLREIDQPEVDFKLVHPEFTILFHFLFPEFGAQNHTQHGNTV